MTLAPLRWPPFRPGTGHNADDAAERDPGFDPGTDEAALASGRGAPVDAFAANTADDDPERAAAMQVMLRKVRVTVDRLPAGQRSALLLVCRHGLSYRDAADVLGVPIEAFAEQLRQAREAVQAGLQPDMCWPDDASSGRYENGALDEDR